MHTTSNGSKWGLRIHAVFYVLANIGQVFTWYYATPDQHFWPIWSIVGWGVGLALHAWATNRVTHRTA